MKNAQYAPQGRGFGHGNGQGGNRRRDARDGMMPQGYGPHMRGCMEQGMEPGMAQGRGQGMGQGMQRGRCARMGQQAMATQHPNQPEWPGQGFGRGRGQRLRDGSCLTRAARMTEDAAREDAAPCDTQD